MVLSITNILAVLIIFLIGFFLLGYTKECYSEKDCKLWDKIKSPDNTFHHLLPPTRG